MILDYVESKSSKILSKEDKFREVCSLMEDHIGAFWHN